MSGVQTLHPRADPVNEDSNAVLSTLSACVGGLVFLFAGHLAGGLFFFLIGLGVLIAVMHTPDDTENTNKPGVGYVFLLSILSGVGIGPLLDGAIDAAAHQILATSFSCTCLIFGCFICATILSNQSLYSYLGCTLSVLLITMYFFSFLNHFVDSHIVFRLPIFLGIAIVCAFTLHDTQIITKRHAIKMTLTPGTLLYICACFLISSKYSYIG